METLFKLWLGYRAWKAIAGDAADTISGVVDPGVPVNPGNNRMPIAMNVPGGGVTAINQGAVYTPGSFGPLELL